MKEDSFHESLTKSQQWLKELGEVLTFVDDRQAVRALRGGLHAIRDRLPASEVVDLGAQLPMAIRGMYYEGWTLGNDPTEMRTREQLLERTAHHLHDPRLDPEEVLRAVIQVLSRHVSRGELDDVVDTLPEPIAELWQQALM